MGEPDVIYVPQLAAGACAEAKCRLLRNLRRNLRCRLSPSPAPHQPQRRMLPRSEQVPRPPGWIDRAPARLDLADTRERRVAHDLGGLRLRVPGGRAGRTDRLRGGGG